MKLGTQVALGPGHIVLHGDPGPPPPKGYSPPIFDPSGDRTGTVRMPMGAYGRNLANTIEPSVRGADAALCQIRPTLTTCLTFI